MSHQANAEREPLLSRQYLQNGSSQSDIEGLVEAQSALILPATTRHEAPLDWKIILAIASTCIGTFLASMDSSIMATLTGPISATYNSFQLMSWYINAYMVAAALIQPLSGKLSDIFGRKAGLIASNVAFLFGNVICGVARRDWQFILGRAVAGLGGGSLHSISTFLISDHIPLRSRGFWQGLTNIAYGVGFAFGGVFGGLMNDHFTWRWAFLSQPVPILLSILLVWIVLPKPPVSDIPSMKRIDFLGSFTLTVGLLVLLYGAISGGNTLPWSHPLVLACFVVAPVIIIAFGYIEENVALEPVIPIRLLRNRTVLGSCCANGLCSMGYTTLVYYIPLELQVRGLGVMAVGLRLMPASIGVFIGSLGSGIFMNVTGRYYILGCLSHVALVVSATLVLKLLSTSISNALPFVVALISGVGIGGSFTITLVALIGAADHKFHASLTSASYAFRTVGNVLGQTISGAIFQNVFREQLWRQFSGRPDAAAQIKAIRHKLTPLQELPLSWQNGVLTAYDTAFTDVWIFLLVSFTGGALAFAIVREHQLHRTLDRS